MSEAAILYEDHLPIIYGRVNSFSKTTGLDSSELLSMANTIFMEAVNRWNPELGKFGPFLNWKLNHRLSRFAKSIPKTEELVNDSRTAESAEIKSFEFMDSISTMDSEAKEVIDLILRSGSEIVNSAVSPREARGLVREMLEDMGWSRNKVTRAFHSIEGFLKRS